MCVCEDRKDSYCNIITVKYVPKVLGFFACNAVDSVQTKADVGHALILQYRHE